MTSDEIPPRPKQKTMQVSKLINDAEIKRALECDPVAALKGRRTGRTLGIILAKIGEAMQEPEKKIPLAKINPQGRWLARFARDVIGRLELKFLDVINERGYIYIQYNILKTIQY